MAGSSSAIPRTRPSPGSTRPATWSRTSNETARPHCCLSEMPDALQCRQRCAAFLGVRYLARFSAGAGVLRLLLRHLADFCPTFSLPTASAARPVACTWLPQTLAQYFRKLGILSHSELAKTGQQSCTSHKLEFRLTCL